jgi:hypothetical protein
VRHSSRFRQLLADQPSIQREINERLRAQSPNQAVTIAVIHRCFLDACRVSGLGLHDYPLKTSFAGRHALERYVRECERSSRRVRLTPDRKPQEEAPTAQGEATRTGRHT